MPKRGPGAVRAEVDSREGFDPAASVGLFVGVSTFGHGRFPEVPFAVDDAVDLAYLFALELDLLRPESVVLALAGEPRKAESQDRLTRLVELGARRTPAGLSDVYRSLGELARSSRPEGLLLLTVATHGVSDQGGDFLIAADSLAERLVKTGLAVDDLFDEVAGARSPRRLVLLDACRERLSADTRGALGAAMAGSFASAIGGATGQVVLSGSTLGGFAYDDPTRGNGVFTAAVLDGLRGAAPADPRGFITARTLADYLQEQVVEWVRRHRPEDAQRCLGIARRIEGPAEALPLAVDPQRSRALEEYRGRRVAALARLRENLGEVLKGSHYDQAAGLLPAEEPQAGSDGLLGEIEALDGGVRAQRSLRDFLRELRGEGAPPSVSPPSTTVPPPGSVRPARPKQTAKPTPVVAAPGSLRRLLRSDRSGRVASLASVVALLGVLGWLLASRLGGSAEPGAGTPLLADDPAAGAVVQPLPTEPPGPAAGTPLDGPLGMRFRFVPAGTYWIGSPADEADAEGEPGRYDDETRHQVRLTRGFWLAETEVTQEQWTELVPENPSSFEACGGDCPVENVNWYEAAAFANRLSEQGGLEACYELSGCSGTLGVDFDCSSASFRDPDCPGFRLPTESEWEIAARAGAETALYTGDLTLRGDYHGPELDAIAWYGGNSGVSYSGGLACSGWPERQHPAETCGTHPVGGKEPNRWGFHDLLGNVREWVGDWYGPYPPGVAVDPLRPDRGSNRVIRGGSWVSYARYVRAAYRNARDPSYRWDDLGFRLARGQVLEQE